MSRESRAAPTKGRPPLDPFKEVDRLIKIHGGQRERHGKNILFRFPNGFRLIMSQTPSDYRAGKNSLAQLRRGLNLNQAKPEPEITKPVLANNERVCRFCHHTRLFPPEAIPSCYECARCGELCMTDKETDGTH